MTTNILTVLSQLAEELQAAEMEVKQREAELKAAKERHQQLNEVTIPDIMDENGISEFVTTDGFKLLVTDKLPLT